MRVAQASAAITAPTGHPFRGMVTFLMIFHSHFEAKVKVQNEALPALSSWQSPAK